jgi:hypothetical protein
VKSRSFFNLLGTVVILLLLSGAGGLYWILSDSPIGLIGGGVTSRPLGSQFISKNAPLMGSLLVNPQRLESLSQLIASPQNRRQTGQQLQDLEKTLLANTGLNYQKEIQPWLGEEITFAVNALDFDRNPDNGATPGYLLVVQTKDSNRAKEFLGANYSKQALSGKYDLVFETYKGVNLIYQRPVSPAPNSRLLASGIVGDYVIFANDMKVLREAINNLQVPDLNLENSPAYQSALATITEPRIGIFYGNIPGLSAWLGKASLPENPRVSQSAAVGLTIKSEGLVAQTALLGVQGQENSPPILSSPVSALSYISDRSYLVAGSKDLNQFWTKIQQGLETNSPLQIALNEVLTRIQTPLGLDIPQEVFGWVTGEYGLALSPTSDPTIPDWVFIAEKVSPEADKGIAHLDELAQKQGYTVAKLPLGNTTVTAWTKLSTTDKDGKATLNTIVKGVHTSKDKYEIFASSVEAIDSSLSSAASIVDSKKFQQAISALPMDNDGYFYIDWREFKPVIEKRIPVVQVLEFAIKPLFNNLRSLTISSQGSENSVRSGRIFFNLGVPQK